MAKFYRLWRYEDVHDNTGTGVVLTAAAIWRGGQIAFLWKGEVPIKSWCESPDQIATLHKHDRGEVEMLDTDKYNSMRVLDMFLEGSPMEEINKKLKKKYLPKEEVILNSEDDDEEGPQTS